jgi:peptide/nickel transport system permease protein
MATTAEGERLRPATVSAEPESGRAALRRLWRLKWGVVAAVVLLLIVGSAVFAPLVAPADPLSVDIRHRLAPPVWMQGTSAHLLGTDQIGRDLLSRIVYGGRISLLVGVAAVLVSTTIGVLLGLAAGYCGPRTDWTIMTLVNVMLTFPFVLLALSVIAVLGPSLVNMIIVLGMAGWPIYCRVIRAETLAMREREFVLAATTAGVSRRAILVRHVVPHVLPSVIVYATLGVATAIQLEAALSFVGIGIQPPDASWGNMISEGQSYLISSPWLVALPGGAIVLAMLGFSLLGDGLRDALDPTLERRGRVILGGVH